MRLESYAAVIQISSRCTNMLSQAQDWFGSVRPTSFLEGDVEICLVLGIY